MEEILVINDDMGKCSDCGNWDYVRPYGKDGATVCFGCMMKNEEDAKEQFRKLNEKADRVVIKSQDMVVVLETKSNSRKQRHRTRSFGRSQKCRAFREIY